MAKKKKIDYKYEVILVDEFTEKELDELAQIFAEMICKYIIQKELGNKESAHALPSPIKQDR